jgi:hypothetical protein
MTKEKESNKEILNLIEHAKHRVEQEFGGVKRDWLEAEPRHSYSSGGYKVKVFVLEGSPPKGYILVDFCWGIVKAFGVRMRLLHTYTVKDSLCI